MANELAAATIARTNGGGFAPVPRYGYGTRISASMPQNIVTPYRGMLPSQSSSPSLPVVPDRQAAAAVSSLGLVQGRDFFPSQGGVLLTASGKSKMLAKTKQAADGLIALSKKTSKAAQIDADIRRRQALVQISRQAQAEAGNAIAAYNEIASIPFSKGLGGAGDVAFLLMSLAASAAAIYFFWDKIEGFADELMRQLQMFVSGITWVVRAAVLFGAVWGTYKVYTFFNDKFGGEEERKKTGLVGTLFSGAWHGGTWLSKKAGSGIISRVATRAARSFDKRISKLNKSEADIAEDMRHCILKAIENTNKGRSTEKWTVAEYKADHAKGGRMETRYRAGSLWRNYDDCVNALNVGVKDKDKKVPTKGSTFGGRFKEYWEILTGNKTFGTWKGFPW